MTGSFDACFDRCGAALKYGANSLGRLKPTDSRTTKPRTGGELDAPANMKGRLGCYVGCSLLVLVALASWAEDDISLRDERYTPGLGRRYFDTEYDLDWLSNAFSPHWERSWRHTENGFRIAAGSLSTNTLLLRTDLKLLVKLTPNLSFRYKLRERSDLEYRGQDFALWETVPRGQVQDDVRVNEFGHVVEFEQRVWGVFHVGAFGQPKFWKRSADVGIAFVLRSAEDQFARFYYQLTDFIYNRKNRFEEEYTMQPIELGLQAVGTFGRWELELDSRVTNCWSKEGFVTDENDQPYDYKLSRWDLETRVERECSARDLLGLELAVVGRAKQWDIPSEVERSYDLDYHRWYVMPYWKRVLSDRLSLELGAGCIERDEEVRRPGEPELGYHLVTRGILQRAGVGWQFTPNWTWDNVFLSEFLDVCKDDPSDLWKGKLWSKWEAKWIPTFERRFGNKARLRLIIKIDIDALFDSHMGWDGTGVQFRTTF